MHALPPSLPPSLLPCLDQNAHSPTPPSFPPSLRIGRTGRAGKTGIAHTFFHQGDKGNAGALVNTLNQAGQEVPADLMKFGTAVKKKEHKLYGAFGPKDGMEEKKATKIVFGDDD